MATLHDKLVEFVLSKHEEFSYPSNSRFGKITAEPEVHYNHYGDRGVVDVVIVKQPKEDQSDFHSGDRCRWDTVTLLEIKAHMEDVGETLRQFKRMRKYFFEDHSEFEPCTKTYELVVYPSPTNLFLVENHRNSFKSLMSLNSGLQRSWEWNVELGDAYVGFPSLRTAPLKIEFPPDAWGPVQTIVYPYIFCDRESNPKLNISAEKVMGFVDEFRENFPSTKQNQIAEVLRSRITPPISERKKSGDKEVRPNE